MLKIANSIPVRTRLPAAAWVIALVVTMVSAVMTEVHIVRDTTPSHQILASLR